MTGCDYMRISKGTIIRTICLVLALVNLTLETFGKKIIPISDEEISELVTLVFTIVTSLAAFWKNNSFTKEAIIADGIMREMKAGLASTEGALPEPIVETVGEDNDE